MKRLASAGTLAIGVLLASAPAPAAACSWVPPSLREVAASADHVFIGLVTEVPSPQTYVVEVERAFRGDPPASMTFEPDPADGLTTCMALEAGERYLIGTDRFEGAIEVGQVWYHLDGDVANGVYLLNWTGTIEALFSELAALPDTSMAPTANLIQLIGLALVTSAAVISVRVGRLRRAARARLLSPPRGSGMPPSARA